MTIKVFFFLNKTELSVTLSIDKHFILKVCEFSKRDKDCKGLGWKEELATNTRDLRELSGVTEMPFPDCEGGNKTVYICQPSSNRTLLN